MRFLLLAYFLVCVTSNQALSLEKDSAKCTFCKKTVATAFQMLQNEETQQDIINKLEKGCKEMETAIPFLGEACYDLLENVVKPQLGEAVESLPTPEAACQMIHYC